MSVLVVTGTGTDVGKTVATAALAALALAAGRRVVVLKPAQTGLGDGEPGDLAEVARLAGDVDRRELARYPDPLAPATAARRCGRPALRRADIAAAVREADRDDALVLVEGAGGLLVRFDDAGLTLADVAADLAAPVLLVTSAGLGTLNTVALTLEALHSRGLALGGLVLGCWPARPGLAERCNVPDLEALTGRRLSGAVPEGSGRLDRDGFLAAARRALAPELGGEFDAASFRAGCEAGG